MKNIKLDDITLLITSGGTPDTRIKAYWDGDIHWLSSGETRNKYIIDTDRKITILGVDNSSTRIANKGDIVVAGAGQGKTRGQVSYLLIDSFINQSVVHIKVNPEYVESKFLFFYLDSKYDELRFLSDSHSSRGSLTTKLLKEYEVFIPPLPTQRKIATILSTYDDLIENNTRRIQILEEMAQAIYREWFVQFRFPGHENVNMVNSITGFGNVPEGWEVQPFSNLVDINPKLTVDKHVNKPYVGMNALSTNSMLIDLGLVEMKTGSSGAKFQNRDVLFPRITPSVENGKAGFVQFLAEGQIAIGSTEIIVFREKELHAEYIYFLSRENGFRGNAINSMVGASGRQRVQPGCFDEYLMVHPHQELLEKFFKTVKPMFEIIHTLTKNNANLRTTRDLLMPKLVNGELDVCELDI